MSGGGEALNRRATPSFGERGPSATPSTDGAESALEEERRLSDEEDQRSIALFLTGDSRGFEELYRKYRERFFGLLLRTLRDREDALEATQEVFVKIHRGLGSYDPKARFFTWAYRVLMNHAIDRIRRRKVRKEQLFDETFTEPRADQRNQHERFEAAGASIEAEEVRERITAAVAGLSEKHREVFVLFSYEGLGYGEIAETLGIPLGTVMSRLYHARRKIREQLPSDWDPGGPERRRETSRRGAVEETESEERDV